MKLLSGTFEDGCGVVISHKDEYYHLIVKDGYVVINGKKVRKEDLEERKDENTKRQLEKIRTENC